MRCKVGKRWTHLEFSLSVDLSHGFSPAGCLQVTAGGASVPHENRHTERQRETEGRVHRHRHRHTASLPQSFLSVLGSR